MSKFMRCSNVFSQKTLKIVMVPIAQLLLISVPSLAFALSTVNLTLKEGSAAEFGQVPGSFTVTRTDDGNLATSIEVWVNVTGSASFGSDYANPDAFFHRGGNTWAAVIAAGELSGTVTFIPNPDNLIEGEETISIQLLDIGVVYTVVEQNTIGLTIADDVAEVTMKLDDGDLAEGGQDPGSFTVTRSANGNVAGSFEVWVVVTGTASFGSDFANPDSFFHRGGNTWATTIGAGELSDAVTFVPNFDNVIEGDETIIIQLLDIGVAYTVAEENTIEMVIADFVETVFEDSFEEADP